MNKATLEVTIAIEADETTFPQIQQRLTTQETDRLALTDLLTDWIKERLILAGVVGDFDVKLNRDGIHVYTDGRQRAQPSGLTGTQRIV